MRFELKGQEFQALNAGPQFPFTEAISISVDCADQADVDAFSAKLYEAGRPASAAGSRTSSACHGRSFHAHWWRC